jgi:hypothetical protein
VARAGTEHARRLAVPDAGGRAADEATWPSRYVLEEGPRALERPAESQLTNERGPDGLDRWASLIDRAGRAPYKCDCIALALSAESFFTLKE